MSEGKLRVGVLGAGAIGGYLGVRLSSAGAAVTLVGRRSLVECRDELHAVALDGSELRAGQDLVVREDPAALREVEVVLVTVKSQATAQAARIVAEHTAGSSVVVSFQNGLQNARILREELGPRTVAGMVSFNVVREAEGARFRQATRGPLVAGKGEGDAATQLVRLAQIFALGGLPLTLRDDIDNVLAGKLLLNLNNGICAVTGLPIVDSLRSPDARWCLSRCMIEGLGVLRNAGYRPASVIGLPPSVIARALRLPNAILLRVAKKLVSADPEARSSTLQDLDAGKPTEIDELNGAIVTLSRAQGVSCPANAKVVEIVRELEQSSAPLPFVTPAHLRERIMADSRA